MRKRVLILIVGLLGAFDQAAIGGITYDAVNDFSATDNPNGAWQYLYGSNSSYSTMTGQTEVNGNAVLGWINDPNQFIPNRAEIDKNFTTTTQSFGSIVLPANLLRMDGEQYDTSVRWTAPSAGNWTIQGLFQGIDVDEGQHNVEVVKNSTDLLLAPTSIDAYGAVAPFNVTVSLNAGDTIDFVDLAGPSPYFLSTGLSAQISTVPEPAGLVLFGVGALGIAVGLRRSKAGSTSQRAGRREACSWRSRGIA